ncbi:hypothetical protein AVEN_163088-2 [Araneus ventricosus]|uniref:Uncharacterized protein n=1 Tax=Araneus ventricosus TaxID=182803 RepID=A0A4Y2I2Y3_ARAVE|nr:hypothetical protein AVEN_163088-2 [Araneus ventricosus]
MRQNFSPGISAATPVTHAHADIFGKWHLPSGHLSKSGAEMKSRFPRYSDGKSEDEIREKEHQIQNSGKHSFLQDSFSSSGGGRTPFKTKRNLRTGAQFLPPAVQMPAEECSTAKRRNTGWGCRSRDKGLFVGNVPTDNSLFTSTVPKNNSLFADIVSTNKTLFAGFFPTILLNTQPIRALPIHHAPPTSFPLPLHPSSKQPSSRPHAPRREANSHQEDGHDNNCNFELSEINRVRRKVRVGEFGKSSGFDLIIIESALLGIE